MAQSHAHRSVERARNRKGAQNRDLASAARRIVRSWASGEDAETLMARLAAHIAREHQEAPEDTHMIGRLGE